MLPLPEDVDRSPRSASQPQPPHWECSIPRAGNDGDAWVRVDGVVFQAWGGSIDPTRGLQWAIFAPTWERGALVRLGTLSADRTPLEVMREVDERWPLAAWWSTVDSPYVTCRLPHNKVGANWSDARIRTAPRWYDQPQRLVNFQVP